MSGVSMCRVVWVRGREGMGIRGREGGACWLPAGGISASQGTFSSFFHFCSIYAIIAIKNDFVLNIR